MKKETACHECSIVVELDTIEFGHEYHCPRCSALLYRPGNHFSHIIVMAIASLITFIPTIFLPILTLDLAGETRSVTLFSTLFSFFVGDHILLGVVAFFSALVIPLSMIVLLLMILIPLQLGYPSKDIALFYRTYDKIKEWGMAEVYMLSIAVAIIKLAKMGELDIGYGFFLFVLFLICFYVTLIWFNPDDIWHKDELEMEVL